MLHESTGQRDQRSVPYVVVGPFRVLDATAAEVVEHVVDLATAAVRPVLVYALHVGGLNARHDPAFAEAMARADAVCADGGSVVWLAKAAGARVIERAPTTDVGWQVLRRYAEALGRPVRLALVGGPAGLSSRAAAVLAADAPVEVVLTDHGYHRDWDPTLRALREGHPDVVLLGMGAPAEMVWAERHRDRLPTALVLTCGGWFGHLVGDERRAPAMLRRSGVEWIARVAQSPRRLAPRYARGLASTAVMTLCVLRPRMLRLVRPR
ncbi:MAG: WecB/TagA/CpsF family glycosyltransferase [Nocardioidaceae bacterium]